MRDQTLVLAARARYADVATALAGWDGGPADTSPWLGGEPLVARWTRDGRELHWSANPAIGLRVVKGTGLDALDGRVRAMSRAEAAVLAESADPARALLGVTALGLIADPAVLPTLVRIGGSSDPTLQGAVELATRRVGLAALVRGAEHVAARRRQHPDRDPVLGLLPLTVRRQVLRHVLAEPPTERRRLRDLVAAGLVDEDWETRWTAVLGAETHGLGDLLLAVRCCPTTGVVGSGTRELLEVVRDVVGHRLAGSRSSHPGAVRVGALLDGDHHDRDLPFLLLTALRTPVPDGPAAAPGFAAVPAVPHWLGGPQLGVRRVVPQPFEIAVITEPTVAVADVNLRLRTWSRSAGRTLRLPTADELEAATRGPDARRYPWGNGRQPHAATCASAWGLAAPLATPEWVATPQGPRALPALGFGAPPQHADVASLRPVAGVG